MMFNPPRVMECFREEKRRRPGLSNDEVIRMCREHVKAACPADLTWESRQGVKEYVQRKTSENPYYALVTGALHGAPADYTQTQPFVDGIMRQGPEAWTDAARNAAFLNQRLKGAKYQFSRQRAPVLAALSRCYVDRGKGKQAALACATAPVKGIGRKGSMLMREYLGDDDAVAVDRHVYNYICSRGFCPSKPARWGSHGMKVPEEVMPAVEKEIRKIAWECGKRAADVQVAAWLKGACETRRKGKKAKRPVVWLGPDKVIHCVRKFYEVPSLRRIALTRRPKWKKRPPRKVKPL